MLDIFSQCQVGAAANLCNSDSTKPLLRSNKNQKHSTGNKSTISIILYVRMQAILGMS